MGLAAESQTTPQYPPMLMQYLDYKERYPDCLLFFQVGDFYEVFFDDAVTVAKTINLTLTSRDKNNPNPVPMCGVPLSVADSYAERLVAQGFSVAIVSQAEASTGKGMVARKLERIITPGIRVLGSADVDSAGGVVAAVHVASFADVSFSYSDINSGKIFIREGFALEDLSKELSKVTPSEVILPKNLFGKPLDRRTAWVRSLESIVPERQIKFRSDADSVLESTRRKLSDISGYKQLNPAGKKAASFLVSYIDEITVEARLGISSIETARFDTLVGIDATTRANLELVTNSRDATTRGTLFEFLNKTVTPGGGRFLRESIISPLLDRDAILFRQAVVEEFLKGAYSIDTVRTQLSHFPDLERIATRLELGIVTPRECGAIRNALLRLPTLLEDVSKGSAKKVLDSSDNASLGTFGEALDTALVDSPPLSSHDGEIFKDSYDSELSRIIEASTKGKEWIAELEIKEREASGISSLKIRFNNVFGYFIEVTNSNLSKVPSRYIRKQTTANSERYITEELKVREEEVLGASDKRIALEKKLFEELKAKALPYVEPLRQLGKRIALLDMLCGFAVKAYESHLVKPEIVDEAVLEIEKGKHPQLSEILGPAFIPNDCTLDAAGKGCAIITGPNMGGKSTYLRQSALIVVLAQIGSYVPAKRARVGITDRIFARLGASDNIAEGESTFMVEMREATGILQSATNRSLLLIDEIGRGTATTDGLALARAILEWLVVKTGARTLFATHFHELTELETVYAKQIKNLSVGSVEEEGQVIFTHEIKTGPANRSYGIEVARLAGLPEGVINRASDLLRSHHEAPIKKQASMQQAFLFTEAPAAAAMPKDYAGLKKLGKSVEDMDIDSLSPREALLALYDLKNLLARDGSKK